MRLKLPFTLLITLLIALQTTAVQAVGANTSLSRQLDLYYTLQQRIAQPGEISNEGLAGLKLLLAQLYSEMGMLLAAEQALEGLQGGPSIAQLRDMGRLLLARQYRLRGELDASSAQLQAIGSGLDKTLDNERQQMLALSALEQGGSDEAMRRYGAVQGGEEAVLLARFNYAALLLKSRAEEHGLLLLQELGEYPHSAEAEAVQALQDRANLLLGYHFLSQQRHQDAERFLRRVRLGGPYSRPALLALGWAELQLRGAEEAMVPWMELLAHGRGDSLDEEAELAIAAAIASKGATQRVIEHYQRLLKQFEQGREKVVEARQRHAQPYAPAQLEQVLRSEDDPLARNSIAAVELAHLLALRQQLDSAALPEVRPMLEESAFFEQLWPKLRALYPEPDELSGIGIAAYVAQRAEAIIRGTLYSSSRSRRPAVELLERVKADRATLDADIAVVAEWYRRSRLAALDARDERLQAYMERARLAIARNHDLALRHQERE